jgi:hypothetical protein
MLVLCQINLLCKVIDQLFGSLVWPRSSHNWTKSRTNSVRQLRAKLSNIKHGCLPYGIESIQQLCGIIVGIVDTSRHSVGAIWALDHVFYIGTQGLAVCFVIIRHSIIAPVWHRVRLHVLGPQWPVFFLHTRASLGSVRLG